MLAHVEPSPMIYAALTRFFGMVADLFFQRRLLGGVVPAEGATLVVANHPNGVIDPVLVSRVAGRRVRFLAKEPLFRMPVLGCLLRQVQALPVYRAKDGHDTRANRDTFAAVYEALEAGEALCIFPEGISHSEPQLQPLKTGAARMVLGTDPEVAVRVVPVGLTYRDKTRFRSEVAVQIGEAVEVGPFRALYAEAPGEAVGALTSAIDAAIREVTVNLERWEDLPLLELAVKVWHGDDDPVTRLRALVSGQRRFEESEPRAVEGVRRRLEGLRSALGDLGLDDPEALDRTYRPSGVSRFVVRNLTALLVGLPAAFLGAVAYFVPYHLVKLPVALLRPPEDLVASVKFLASMLFFLVWQVLLMSWLVWHWQGLGVWLGLGLALCGVYTHHFLERRVEALRELTLLARLPSEGALRRALRDERDGIRSEIEALAERS